MDEYFETFGGVRDYLGGIVDEARRTRLHRDDPGPSSLPARPHQRQPPAPRDGRADGAQRADPGLGRRHHQGRHAQRRPRAARRRAGARGCCSRSTTSWSSRSPTGERDALEALVREQMASAAVADRPPRRLRRHRPAAGTPPPTDPVGRRWRPEVCRLQPAGGYQADDQSTTSRPCRRASTSQQQLVRRSRPASQPDDREQGRPDQVTDVPGLACQHAVDHSCSIASTAAEQGEDPQLRPRSRRTLAADEDHGQSGEQHAARGGDADPAHHHDQALQQGAPARLRQPIEGNASTTTNWGRNSTALTRISPPAYRPAWCSSSTLRATRMSTLESAKNASRALELWSASRHRDGCVCSSESSPGSRGCRTRHPADQTGRTPRSPPRAAPRTRWATTDHRGPDEQPGHARGEVDPRQGIPLALALEDPRLRAHHRHGGCCKGGERGRGQAVETDDLVDHRGECQAQDAQPIEALTPTRRIRLSIWPTSRCGRDPSRGRRLQGERDHHGDEEQAHHGREGSVVPRTEEAGGDHREPVAARFVTPIATAIAVPPRRMLDLPLTPASVRGGRDSGGWIDRDREGVPWPTGDECCSRMSTA